MDVTLITVLMRETKELTLSDEFLDQLRARDPDEGTVSVVGHGSGQQGLACAWGTIQQHTLQTGKIEIRTNYTQMETTDCMTRSAIISQL